jgi:hypothetical protein
MAIPSSGVNEHCSDGVTVFSSPERELQPEPALEPTGNISWTKAALFNFWQYVQDLRAAGSLGPIGLSFIQRSESRQTLNNGDFIKVYVDSQWAIYIRTAIDLWKYKPSEARGIRLLKGARLLLVDEMETPIFTG